MHLLKTFDRQATYLISPIKQRLGKAVDPIIMQIESSKTTKNIITIKEVSLSSKTK